jgi:hypothetical protein
MAKILGLAIGMALCAGGTYDMPDPGSLVLFIATGLLVMAAGRPQQA